MLYLIATPIGNREDITLRALRVLKEVDFVLAEDTRKTGQLLKYHGIEKKPFYSFHEHNERRRIDAVIHELRKGKTAALLTNAGCPLISDPGYGLVCECIAYQIPVTAVPGPSAVLNALMLSGLPCDRFIFLGFLPRKPGARAKTLEAFTGTPMTLVLFESPYRIEKLLGEIQRIFGEVRCALVREMTKVHEEVIRGTPAQLKNINDNAGKPRGEYTVVIEINGK
ncbi:MAG: 16S rRNA (cytidine(1402)-2'-O)-methyltransferase [Candidatus Omnitrophica bacterium]|nr:16S rRNA (cytidine(1402)-2'-O)-methyltransferase [Candidatus Omnitrophota bacterium]